MCIRDRAGGKWQETGGCVPRARRWRGTRSTKPLEAPLLDVPGKIENLCHSLGDDPRDLGDFVHDVAVLAKVRRVLQHENMGIDPKDLVAKLLLEPPGDAHH